MTLYWVLRRTNIFGQEVFYNPRWKYRDATSPLGAHWYTTKRAALRANRRLNGYWQVEPLEVEVV